MLCYVCIYMIAFVLFIQRLLLSIKHGVYNNVYKILCVRVCEKRMLYLSNINVLKK